MRVTNNMLLTRANANMNTNKLALDKGNTQMTTQRKIDRPSEDPIVAVRSLRLQTSLQEINQYYGRNIPDAQSWLEVSETALMNISGNIDDFRKLCVAGANGATLTQDDRKTMLDQLKSLQESIFQQGNADYAGRTVFTGYRTDRDLVFKENEDKTRYDIGQVLKADDMENFGYYNGGVDVPGNRSEIAAIAVDADGDGVSDKETEYDMKVSSYYRLRLGYDDISQLESINIAFDAKNQSETPVQITRSFIKGNYEYDADMVRDDKGNIIYEQEVQKDANGQVQLDANGDPVKDYIYLKDKEGKNIPAKDAAGNVIYQTEPSGALKLATAEDVAKYNHELVVLGEALPEFQKQPVLEYSGTNAGKVNYPNKTDKDYTLKEEGDGLATKSLENGKTYQVLDGDSYDDKNTTGNKNNVIAHYQDENGEDIYLYQTNNEDVDEFRFPKKIYQFDNEEDWLQWSKENGYDRKTVEDEDCVFIKSTGDLIFGETASSKLMSWHAQVTVQYDKIGFDNGELRPEYYYDAVNKTDLDNQITYKKNNKVYEINYTVSQNQTLTVNQEAADIFDSDILQDMNDMITAVQKAMSASDKVEKIKVMLSDTNYQDEETQAQLKQWKEIAQKEMDYYNHNLDELFTKKLKLADDYLNEINVAITRIGCTMDQLAMTEERMDEQEQAVTKLKSDNDNLDLSTIMINYMAAHTAYQSSLQGASKLGQQTLLNYI